MLLSSSYIFIFKLIHIPSELMLWWTNNVNVRTRRRISNENVLRFWLWLVRWRISLKSACIRFSQFTTAIFFLLLFIYLCLITCSLTLCDAHKDFHWIDKLEYIKRKCTLELMTNNNDDYVSQPQNLHIILYLAKLKRRDSQTLERCLWITSNYSF